MKKSSFLYAIFFLLISPAFLFAADINLKDTSSGKNKTITVEVDTKGEVTNSLKVVVFFSNNVTISETTQGDFQCGTFSGEQVGSTVEITCTTQGDEAISSSIAEINFTASTDDYSFTVMTEDSAIGDLTIEDTSNIGVITISADAPAQNSDSVSSSNNDTKGIKEYLPYILLGVAGIFLLSIIILVATKGKKTDSPKLAPTETQVTTPEPTPSAEIKPTLQEMVNSHENIEHNTEVTPVPATEIQEPTIQSNHEGDLEALLTSENPRMDSTVTPPINPLTAPAPEEPLMENPLGTPEITTSYGMPSQEEQPYIANTAEGGLPSIGTQSPATMTSESIETFNQPSETPLQQSPTMPEVSPVMPQPEGFTTPFTTEAPPVQNFDQAYTTTAQPEISPSTIETPQPGVGDAFSSLNGIPAQQAANDTVLPETPALSQNTMDMDLQALVNNEVNNIPTPPEAPNTVPPQDTTQV